MTNSLKIKDEFQLMAYDFPLCGKESVMNGNFERVVSAMDYKIIILMHCINHLIH